MYFTFVMYVFTIIETSYMMKYQDILILYRVSYKKLKKKTVWYVAENGF